MSKLVPEEIVPGLWLEQIPGSYWLVTRIISFPGEKIPHVQVMNERDPSRIKTISLSTILDHHFFRRVA